MCVVSSDSEEASRRLSTQMTCLNPNSKEEEQGQLQAPGLVGLEI